MRPEVERYCIELWRIPDAEADDPLQWQADCGNAHARGETAEEAAEQLIFYLRLQAGKHK